MTTHPQPRAETLTLAAFLSARLDEDEAARWLLHEMNCPDVAEIRRRGPRGWTSCACGGPARVLAEVGAKRAILRYSMSIDGGDHLGAWIIQTSLASVYASHPDYRAEWAVS